MVEKKWVYLFGESEPEVLEINPNHEKWAYLLGERGMHQRELARAGVPFVPGFVITSESSTAYQSGDLHSWRVTWNKIRQAIKSIEQQTGKIFGADENPLLVDCRTNSSGSMVSLMEPILGIGLNDKSVVGFANFIGNRRFAFETYTRFIWALGIAVFDVPGQVFEGLLELNDPGVTLDDLSAENWFYLVGRYKQVFHKHTGVAFPEAPYEQLRYAVEAGFRSWSSRRAASFERVPGFPAIKADGNNPISINAMVFGNAGGKSGYGAVSTRNPTLGEREMCGEYALNRENADDARSSEGSAPICELETDCPQAFASLVEVCTKLENHFRDAQYVKFCVEKERVWVLESRTGKRTTRAAVKMAVDMVKEGLIAKDEAVLRAQPDQIMEAVYPQFDFSAVKNEALLAMGVGASPGAATGRVYFDADTAERMAHEQKQNVIFVRPFFSPEDVHGMLAADGLITLEGGAASNAAEMAQQFSKPYVTEVSAIEIDLEHRELVVNNRFIREGDWLSVDGGTGAVFQGRLALIEPKIEDESNLYRLLEWADEICAQRGIRKKQGGSPTIGVQVWANADYPNDAWRARSYGAKGIGLCRSEHMFFEVELLPIVQHMILAKTPEERKQALSLLLPSQINHFEGFFEAMDGYPVVIRLMDTPLNEFLPEEKELLEDIITMRVQGEKENLTEKELLLVKIRSLSDTNPAMGLRGARLGVLMPEIMEMQVRAIYEAAANVMLKGVQPNPRIMVPMTSMANELRFIIPRLEKVAKAIMDEREVDIPCVFGAVLEIPRAAVTAEEFASLVKFFSFDTDDLTQLAYGFTRGDIQRVLLQKYLDEGILPKNPFHSLDTDGVGKLMEIAIREGRKGCSALEVGVFGEQASDLSSIAFFHRAGVNYVSCPPLQVPAARLAVAHTAIRQSQKKL